MFVLLRFSLMFVVYWIWGYKSRKCDNIKIFELRSSILIMMLILDVILVEKIF